jgi:osmotically-inducible protein OsmY
VRSVVDLVTVKPVLREDEVIVRDVTQVLAESPPLDRYALAVTAKGGVVTLQGTVDAWTLSRLARRKAMSIKGVSDVLNQIDVKIGRQRSDGEIQTLVERRLAADLYVDASGVKVGVQNGVVTLKGSVGTAAEKRRAEENASIFGVDAVNVQALSINPDLPDRMRRQAAFVTLSDDKIRRAVKDALELDPRVNAYSIAVTVADGMVTLTGLVDTLFEKKIAERDVLNTTGVWQVKNKLTLRYRAFPTDAEVEKRIYAVFQRDAELHDLEIHVAVDDLHGRLYGTVNAMAQKIRAENIASQIGGVLSLDNDIRVSDLRARANPDQPGDAELTARIRDELFWDPFVDSDRIEVTVKDAHAVLKGTAAGLFAAHSAVQNAFEGGARSVRTAFSLDTGRRLDAFFKRDAYQFRLRRIFPDDP